MSGILIDAFFLSNNIKIQDFWFKDYGLNIPALNKDTAAKVIIAPGYVANKLPEYLPMQEGVIRFALLCRDLDNSDLSNINRNVFEISIDELFAFTVKSNEIDLTLIDEIISEKYGEIISILVYQRNGEIISLLILTEYVNMPLLAYIWTKKSHRGGGFASLLLHISMRNMKLAGREQILVAVNENNRSSKEFFLVHFGAFISLLEYYFIYVKKG